MAGSLRDATGARAGAALALLLVGCGASGSSAPEPRGASHVASAPERDGDGDEIALDACPSAAEDLDGYRDEDGCPDTDNDADGMADTDDRCPNDPESYDGVDDEDGCPDRHVTLVIDDAPWPPIAFADGSAALDTASLAVLASVAADIERHAYLVEIGMVGHSDRTERRRTRLARRRAEAVRDALVDRGVPPARLIVLGVAADDEDPEGARDHRFVELRVMTVTDGPVLRWRDGHFE